jgi:hypothetical protein
MMNRIKLHFSLAVSTALMTLALLPALAAQTSLSQSASRQKTAGTGMMPMPLVAPLFIEDDQRTSVITMVNNAPQGVDVDVVLYSLSGDRLVQQTVALSPHSERAVSVRDLLQDSAVQYGSVFLAPHRNSTMAAQLSIAGRSGNSTNDVEEEFQMLTGSDPADFRAVSVSTAPLIAVRSLSSEAQTLSVTCLQGQSENQARNGKVSIGPNRTLLIDACAKGGPKVLPNLQSIEAKSTDGRRAVAVSVSSSVPSSDLALFGFGSVGAGSDSGFVAIPFTDRNGLKSSAAVFPGITSAARNSRRLQAAIANFGATTHRATFVLTETGAQKEVATVQLAPHSVSVANLADALNGAHEDASFVVNTDGEPGEVMSGIQAVASPNGSSFDVTLPWKDRSERANGGQHPWRIDGGFSSTLLLFNPDQSTANSITVSVYADNKAWTKLVPVPPQATVAIRLNDIVDKQEPDDKGGMLPPGSTHGIVGWFTLANPRVFGQLIQADVLSHVVRPFACAQYTNVCGADVTNLTVEVGQQGSVSAIGKTCGSDGACTCIEQCGSTGGGAFSGWGSSDTTIASLVSSNGGSATFQGNRAGGASTFVTVSDATCTQGGSGTVAVNAWVQIRSVSVSPTTINTSSSPTTATVTVQVAFSVAGITNPGATIQVLTASGSPAGNNVSYSPSSQTVSLSGASPQTVQFTVSAGPSTVGGSVVIQGTVQSVSGTGGTIVIKDPNPASNGETPLTTTTN